jgi:hypothetical protein
MAHVVTELSGLSLGCGDVEMWRCGDVEMWRKTECVEG